VIRPDGFYNAQQRFGLYRWHIMDPVRFEKDLRVTIQALGWQSGGRYLPLKDDIATTAFCTRPNPRPVPGASGKDELEIHDRKSRPRAGDGECPQSPAESQAGGDQ